LLPSEWQERANDGKLKIRVSWYELSSGTASWAETDLHATLATGAASILLWVMLRWRMRGNVSDASALRTIAREIRAMAKTLTDPENRRTVLNTAKGLEKLAHIVEAKAARVVDLDSHRRQTPMPRA
jgi:hypothetical protein